MANQETTFEQVHRSRVRVDRLPSSVLEIGVFMKVAEVIHDFNKTALEVELSFLRQAPGESEDDFKKRRQNVKTALRVSIQILGANGELFYAFNQSIFEEGSSLPDQIEKITLDNYSFYQSTFNRIPSNSVKIEFDFSKSKIFDFTTSASQATPNQSSISIQGQSETLVEGTYERILAHLRDRKTRMGWLHKTNVYDILVWFLAAPLVFWNLHKLNPIIDQYASTSSSVFNGAIYIYLFVVILLAFRFLFNYARWLFPYLELKTPLRGGAIAHRVFLATLVLALIRPIITDGLKFLIRLLF